MEAATVELWTFDQIPDRGEGEELVRKMEKIRSEYEKYVASLEKEGSQRKELILTLELSELFYDAQLGECNILTTVGFIFISTKSIGKPRSTICTNWHVQ